LTLKQSDDIPLLNFHP